MFANRKTTTRLALVLLILALVVSAFGIVGAQDTAPAPFLGIGLSPVDNGVKVEAVQAASPAETAGVKVGDIITAVDGTDITSDTIRDVIAGYDVGDEIKLTVTRGSETLELALTLAERPAEATEPPVPTVTERPMIGVQLEDGDDGVVIRAVAAGSPAEEAGLKVGDVLTKIGDTEIIDAASASTAVQALTIGDEVAVEVTRDGETLTVQVTLAAATPPMMNMNPMRNSMSITFNDADKSWTINNLAEQTELYKAGLRTGDKITLFDGTAYDAAGLREYLASAGKTEITLTVSRDGSDQEITVPVSTLILFNRGAFDMTPGDMPFFNMPFGMGGSRLGVEFLTLNADVAAENNVTETVGALVTKVVPESPAEKAGLLANDVVVSVDGDTVDEEHTLRDRLIAYEPGDTVKLEIMRDGAATEIEVTLEQMPMTEGFPFFNQDGHNFQFEIPAPQLPQEPALNGTTM